MGDSTQRSCQRPAARWLRPADADRPAPGRPASRRAIRRDPGQPDPLPTQSAHDVLGRVQAPAPTSIRARPPTGSNRSTSSSTRKSPTAPASSCTSSSSGPPRPWACRRHADRYITRSAGAGAVLPGDEAIERRIRRLVRWNAVAMVLRANSSSPGIGAPLHVRQLREPLRGWLQTGSSGQGPGPRTSRRKWQLSAPASLEERAPYMPAPAVPW